MLLLFGCILTTVKLSNCRTHFFATNTSTLPNLLLISFDGFRAQYLQDHSLSFFEELIDDGIYATIKSEFATTTFPNHFSMVTGLRPEKHGIIDNTMYDKFLNESFAYSCCDKDIRWFAQNPLTLPIYIYNKMARNGRNSFTINFLGSLATYWGEKMSGVEPFNSKLNWTYIMDNITARYLDSENPINFGAIYFNEPDSTGHAFGPRSVQVAEKLEQVNNILGYLKCIMKRNDLWQDMNIIVTTDHGMTDVYPHKSIVLEDYMNMSRINYTNALTIAHIFTKTVREALEIKHRMMNISHFSAYLREETPDQFHFRNNIRIGDVVILPEKGYLIYARRSEMESSTIRGSHGYDNNDADMKGILIARGPAIRSSSRKYEVELVDLYPLMTRILELPERETDGNYSRISSILE